MAGESPQGCAPVHWTPEAAGLGLWTIRRADAPAEPRIIGCAGLLRVGTAAKFDTSLAGAVEPLIALAPEEWGRGYALESLGAILQYGLNTLHGERIVAVTDVPNDRSDRLLRRLGFTPVRECEGPHYRLRTYDLRG